MRSLILGLALVSTALAPVAASAQDSATANPADAATAAADAKAAAKAAKEAQRAEAARIRNLQRQYGLGPYPEEIDNFLSNKPEALKPYYRTLYVGGERNSVLNFQRLGLAAIDQGLWKDAEWAFDHALDRIEAIFGDNAKAAAARSAFHNESNKDFKGEPYERSMAYYYRGLLYLRAGDFGNARATFKSAEYQDTLSEVETFQSDFAVMNYLIGWTQQCEGQSSSAKESFDIAAKYQPGLIAPAAGDNVLFVAELGNGPVKARDGASAQKLIFQAGPAYAENAAAFEVGNGKSSNLVTMRQASSVYYQATTRGGRPIDGIMQGKATLKEGSNAVGSALLNQGLSSGDTTMMGIGLAMSLFSGAVKTKADIRQWDGLPDLINVGTMKAPGSNWTATPKFMRDGASMDASGPVMQATPKQCSIVWARSQHVTLPADIVGEDAGVAASVSRQAAVQQKNKAFRASIES